MATSQRRGSLEKQSYGSDVNLSGTTADSAVHIDRSSAPLHEENLRVEVTTPAC